MKCSKKIKLPNGFMAAGVASGVKKSGRADLALIVSESASKVAALFTTNKIKAAHIKVCKAQLKKSKESRALVINSGNANCFNGNKGVQDAKRMVNFVADHLDINNDKVLIASTGIIGKPLDLIKIKRAVPALVEKLSSDGLTEAARAIMTTDTFVKIATRKIILGGKTINLCGFAKGAGMISPDMATMLCFILTDAAISSSTLKTALKEAVSESFNCITVDGCMSTNDTTLIMANAQAGNRLINTGTPNYKKFTRVLGMLCLDLAKMIVLDGEGANKFIEIKVKKAKTFSQAKEVALRIANSNLFKTAIYGENPNHGRIVAAVGSSNIEIEESQLKIKVSPLHSKNIRVLVELNSGRSEASVYTSDLTPEYIKINAEYN